ncbi:MAG: hypothetical protein QM757_15225 [Paludibaculum sp.]
MIRGRCRQVLIALSLGCILAFGLNFWFVAVTTPENIENYLWLANLNEPGAYVAERVFRSLHLRFGERWSYRAAILGGYTVVVLIWSVASLAALHMAGLTAAAIKTVRGGEGETKSCSRPLEPVAFRPHCPGSVPVGALSPTN